MIKAQVKNHICHIGKSFLISGVLLSSTLSYAYTSSELTQNLLKDARTQGAIKVIVTVKPQTNQVMAEAQKHIINSIKPNNLKTSYSYKFIPSLAMTVTESGLKTLIKNPSVISIEQDQQYSSAVGESSAASEKVLNAYIPTKENNERWAVAVIDSGVDTSHYAFNGRIIDEACYSSNDVDSTGLFRGNYYSLCPGSSVNKPVRESTAKGSGVNCQNELQRLSKDLNNLSIRKGELEACSHGTEVAGVITGLFDDSQSAKFDADIIAIQVKTGIRSRNSLSSSSFSSDIIKGLERVLTLSHAKKHKIAAVNLSISGLPKDKTVINSSASCKTTTDNNGKTNKGLRAIIAKLKKAGIATVIAAGNNDATDGVGGFSCISDAITVGAVDHNDQRWDGCTDNQQFDFKDIQHPTKYRHTSPVYESVFKLNKPPYLGVRNCGSNSGQLLDFWALGSEVTTTDINNGKLNSIVGTSFAAPLVASAWATMKMNYPNASYADIETAFKKTGKIIKVAGVSRPRIDLEKALESLKPISQSDNKITPIKPASNDAASASNVSFTWKDINRKLTANTTRNLYTVMIRTADTNKRVFFQAVSDSSKNCSAGTCLKKFKLKSGNYKWQVGYYEEYKDGSYQYLLESDFINFSVK